MGTRGFFFANAISLKTRMAITVVTLVLMTTVLVTFVSLVLAKRGMKDVIGAQQLTLLTRAVYEIDQKMAGRQIALQTLSAGIPEEAFRNALKLQRYLRQHSSLKSLFDNVSVINTQGTVIATLSESAPVGINLMNQRHVRDTLMARKSVISPPMPGSVKKKPFIVITAPVLDERGQVVLVLAGTIDLAQDNFISHFAETKIGQTGYCYIFTDTGTIVSHPDKERILERVVTENSYGPALVRALAGFEGTVEADPQSGMPGLLSFQRLKSTNWILGAVYPEAEAFAPLADVENKAVIAVAILAFLIGPLVWWITRLQISPLQQLSDRIQAIRDEPTQAAVAVQYRNDEMGSLALAVDNLMREHMVTEFRHQSTEAELRAAIDASLDAFFIFHAERDENGHVIDFRFQFMNTNAERLIGMDRYEVLNERLCEVLPVIRSEGLFEKYVRVVETGMPMQDEFPLKSPQIHAQWLHTQVVSLADGLAITMRDITDRKRDEIELRHNRAFLQSLIDYLPVVFFVKDFRVEGFGRMIVWNKAAEVVSGYPADMVIGRTNIEIFPSRMAKMLDEVDGEMLAHPKVSVIDDAPFRRLDGGLRYLHSISVPLFGEDGKVEYILGIVEDITSRREQEHELREHQAELVAVSDASPLGLFRTGLDGRCTYANRTFEQIAGINLNDLLERDWMPAVHPEDRSRVSEEWARSTHDAEPYYDMFRFLHVNGRIVWVSVKAVPIVVDGEVAGYAGAVDDVTARRASDEALFNSEQRLRLIADNIPALIAYVDPQQRFAFGNRKYEEAFGICYENLTGMHAKNVLGPQAYAESRPYILAALEGTPTNFERLITQGDSSRWERVSYVPDFDINGKVLGFFGLVEDITALKLVEHQLRTLARFDPLTGLANRTQFEEKLADAVRHSCRNGLPIAIMFLDIDHFKSINDSLGHHGGDDVLKEFANRLLRCVRQTDTVARLAGDEFVILLEGLQLPDEALIIARKIIFAMEEQFTIGDVQRAVTTSIGIAVRKEDEVDPEALLRRADEALYLAKSAGRNTFESLF